MGKLKRSSSRPERKGESQEGLKTVCRTKSNSAPPLSALDKKGPFRSRKASPRSQIDSNAFRRNRCRLESIGGEKARRREDLEEQVRKERVTSGGGA